MMNNKSAVLLLSSLAQEARLDIFRLLVRAGSDGLAAGAIGVTLKIPASTLSFHLKELSIVGLIKSRQAGRFIYYSANYDAMNSLLEYLTENCCADQPLCHPDSNCNTIKKEIKS